MPTYRRILLDAFFPFNVFVNLLRSTFLSRKFTSVLYLFRTFSFIRSLCVSVYCFLHMRPLVSYHVFCVARTLSWFWNLYNATFSHKQDLHRSCFFSFSLFLHGKSSISFETPHRLQIFIILHITCNNFKSVFSLRALPEFENVAGRSVSGVVPLALVALSRS